MSELEQKVTAIWNEILEVSDGQEDAHFFDLKGDSISAVRLVSRVEEELGIILDVGDIFETDPDLPAFLADVLAKSGGTDRLAS
jgi:acyl carrier protein